ncbi:MAG: tetratricopeptide repeat protein [Planctomycetota bacterium]|jgi:tetratricopeptide (TPR) repeat protein
MTIIKIRSGFLIIIFCLAVLEGICGCAGSPPAKPIHEDRTFVETTITAHTAFQQGRINEAATLYQLALKRAHALDQPSAIGNAAYNLAACMLRLRKYDRARTLLTEARHELARVDSPLADILLLEARAAYLAGDIDAAGVFIHQLRTDPESEPVSEHLAQAFILEGHIACERRDWSIATELLEQVRDHLQPDPEASLQAHEAGLAGRIAAGKQDHHTAVEAFNKQAELLRHAGHYPAISPAIAKAGEAYLALGKNELAADYFYRAARNAAAWDDNARAKEWALAALSFDV